VEEKPPPVPDSSGPRLVPMNSNLDMKQKMDGARIAVMSRAERRRGYRISIRLEVDGTCGRFEVVGVLANISYSGALIEDTSMQPEIGTAAVLYLYLKPPGAFHAVSPFRLTGNVVRHSSTGFAVEFTDRFDPDVRRLVDDAAAILTAQR
jgi:hypothetical protein